MDADYVKAGQQYEVCCVVDGNLDAVNGGGVPLCDDASTATVTTQNDNGANDCCETSGDACPASNPDDSKMDYLKCGQNYKVCCASAENASGVNLGCVPHCEGEEHIEGAATPMRAPKSGMDLRQPRKVSLMLPLA